MKTRIALLGLACALAWAPQARAFGKLDLLHIGVRAVAELAGAAIDKGIDAVKESLRDPEAEAREKAEKERALAERLQKEIEAVEARTDLRPIERERLVLGIIDAHRAAREMEAFVERAEAAQRARRDSLFTLGGIAGVIGEAAMTSPSMVVHQADLMTKDPLWRAEVRARNAAVFDRAEALAATGTWQTILEAGRTGAQPVQNAPGDAGNTPPTSADDPFALDLGRSLWVEFEGSRTETARLREHLRKLGHRLAEDRADAEVTYLVQGEYTVAESRVNEGVSHPVGPLLDDPRLVVPPPRGKTMGRFARGLGALLFAANGADVPQPTEAYRQEALLLIARMPKEGRQTRVSVRQRMLSKDVEAHTLARLVRNDLYARLGLSTD